MKIQFLPTFLDRLTLKITLFMKLKKIVLLLFTFCTVYSNAQFSEKENEMMEIVKENGSSIPPSVFLDTTILVDLQIANSTSWRHIWMDIEDSTKQIMQLYDIRLKFDSKKKALKFHKKFLGLNSEYGPEIYNHKINFNGASKFSVFSGSPEFTKMMDPYGYKIFCILFVVDNYFAKIYLTCAKEKNPADFQKIVSSAIIKIKQQAN